MRALSHALVLGVWLLAVPAWADGAATRDRALDAMPPQIHYQETLRRHLHPVDPAVYVLGPGDVLTVALWGEYNDTRIETISADGKILLPIIGVLRLSGMTIAQAEALLQRAVGTYYRQTHSGLALQSLREIQEERPR